MDMLIRSGEEGMNVRRLVKQVYNHHCDMFTASIDYGRLYNQIRSYLWRQSQLRYSPIVRSRRGQYALKSDVAVQLDIFIDFRTDSDFDPPEQAAPDGDLRQLTLF